MRLLRWMEDGALYIVIALALASGLAASFGRELEARRRPDAHWWLRRLLIMPILAITASMATDLFDLRPSVAAFTAAMLSLGGYDVLRLIETRWRRRAEAATDQALEVLDGESAKGPELAPPASAPS